MIPALDQALRSVPFLATLGVRVEEGRPGHVVLRLPHDPKVTNHAGALHTAAIFAVGELAAAVVLATHPEISRLRQLQKSSKIKYYLPSTKDVTAHASLTDDMVRAVRERLPEGEAKLMVTVKVLDGHGADVAEVVTHFALRSR